ncbi:MAG: carboxypeptidase-like regulatory domain-containing protein, partial [Planctomycetota bacterium]
MNRVRHVALWVGFGWLALRAASCWSQAIEPRPVLADLQSPLVEVQKIQANLLLDRWHVLGPLDCEDGIAEPFSATESSLSPFEPLILWGDVHPWKFVPKSSLHFRRVFKLWGGDVDKKCVFAWTRVRATTDQSWDLSLGYDDEVIVYVDGREIFRDDSVSVGCSIDHQRIPIELTQGEHDLLIKVANGGGNWDLVARFLPSQSSDPWFVLNVTNDPWGDVTRMPTVRFELLDDRDNVLHSIRGDGYRNSDGWVIQYPVYKTPQKQTAIVEQQPVNVRMSWSGVGIQDRVIAVPWAQLQAGDVNVTFEADPSPQFQFVDGITGTPLEDVQLWLSEKPIGEATGQPGHQIAKHFSPFAGTVFASASGYQHAKINLQFPFGKQKTVAMNPGGRRLIGRVVSSADQSPIADAVIRPGLYRDYRPVGTSDEDGYFEINSIGDDKTILYPVVTARGYVAKDVFSVNLNGPDQTTEVLWSLDPASTVTGRITDAITGRPIGGVTVTAGESRFASNRENPEATTDEDGRYLLSGLPDGPAILHAIGKDHAPVLASVVARPGQSVTSDFQMLAGKSVQGRVVDPQGAPVANAWIVTDTWNGYRMFRRETRTDADGRYELPHMPDSEVETDFLKRDYISVRNQKLVAGQTHDVILRPVLEHIITLRAKGRQTPISDIEVQKGYQWTGRDEISWVRRDYERDANYDSVRGIMTIRTSEPTDARIFFRFRAPGLTEAVFEVPQEATEPIRLTLELQPVEMISGRVEDAETGAPLANAAVLLATPDDRLRCDYYTNYQLPIEALDRFTGSYATTDQRGRFQLSRGEVPDGSQLVVLGRDGSFVAFDQPEAILAMDEVVLSLPKATRIVGKLTQAGEPSADERVRIEWLPPKGPDAQETPFSVGGGVTTRPDGGFEFPGLGPGRYQIQRVKSFQSPNRSGGMSMYLSEAELTVAAGQPKHYPIKLPAGIHIEGVIQDRDAAPVPLSIVTLRPANQRNERVDVVRASSQGRYRFDHVVPGNYAISVDQYESSPQFGFGNVIGQGHALVRVDVESTVGAVIHKDITVHPKIDRNLDASIKGKLAPQISGRLFGSGDKVAFDSDEHFGKIIA